MTHQGIQFCGGFEVVATDLDDSVVATGRAVIEIENISCNKVGSFVLVGFV
jgi:hypothetical protein